MTRMALKTRSLSGGGLRPGAYCYRRSNLGAEYYPLTNRTGLNVKDIVLQQLASGESVLSEDERELG